MKVEITISDDDIKLIMQFLEATQHADFCSHGPLTLEKLGAMLFEDVALTISRPGSWEGSHMLTVLGSHGYSL
jgi:hypothetical protein